MAFTQRGVKLAIEGSSLVVEGQLKMLTDDDRQFLKQNKDSIIEYLKTLNVVKVSLIPKYDNNNSIPLSYAQKRLWFIEQVDQETAQYSMPIVLRVDGAFDTEIANKAINKIIERHHILRTCYKDDDGEAKQVIRENFHFEFKQLSVNEEDCESNRKQIESTLQKEASKRFNLSSDLMIRGLEIKVKSNGQKTYRVLLLNMHHIAADGWSMGVLISEFSSLYRSLKAKEHFELPELDIQYSDFAAWQQLSKNAKSEKDSLSYWQHQLADSPVTHSIPLDSPRPNLKQSKGGYYSESLEESVVVKLEALAKKYNVTLFMLIHSALALCISKFSDEDDIVIGTPFANRTNRQLEPLIGFFVNTLVLRSRVDHEDFDSFIKHIQSVNLDAQSNQDIPFEKVVEISNAPRTSSYTPLFQIMLSMNNTQQQKFDIDAVSFSNYPLSEITSKYDIELEVNLSETELNLDWIYDLSIFTKEKIARISSGVKRLLFKIAEGENFKLNRASILSSQDVDYLTKSVNELDGTYLKDKCIHECIEEQVLKTPEEIAVVSGNKMFSYTEINQQANLLANELINKGAKKGDFIGLSAERTPEMVIAILGILKTGCAYVPLDTKLPKERLEEIVIDTGIRLKVVQRCYLTEFNDDENLIVLEDLDPLDKVSDKSLLNNISRKVTTVDSQDLAYVVYTSGSTGKPKGIMVEHHSMLARLAGWDEVFGLNKQPPNILQMADFSVDICLGDIVKSLATGGRLILCDKESLLDASKLYELIEGSEITFGDFVPSVLRVFMDYMESKGLKLDKMKHILIGSESWYGSDLSRLRKLIGSDTRCFNIYGQTESVIDVSYYDVTELTISEEAVIPFGRVFNNTSLYLLDRHQQLQPVGAPGEICIGGAGLARGYLNLPTLTKQKFISTALINENPEQKTRLYKTGDHAIRQEDGSLKFMGRKDHQIKIRGFRIELSEIEETISTCEYVQSNLVTLHEESQKLVAYLISSLTNEQQKLNNIKTVKKILGTNLPHYMMPSAFIYVDSWPLNSAGKIDRSRLPKPENSQLSEHLVAPETESEKAICRIWCKVLGISSSEIGTNSDFFEKGGHSLLLTRVSSEIRKVFSVELSMRELFEKSLLAELAEYVTEKIDQNHNNKQRFEEVTSTKASQTEELVI